MPLLAQQLKPRTPTRIIPQDPSTSLHTSAPAPAPAESTLTRTPTKRSRPRSPSPSSDEDTRRSPSPRPRAPTRRMSTPSTPSKSKRTLSKRTPTNELEETRRSTRSTGKADHFQPLQGAPVTPRSSGKRGRAVVVKKEVARKMVDSSGESEEDEVVVTPRAKRGRAASTKTAAKKPTRAPPKKRVKVEEEEDESAPEPKKTRGTARKTQRPPSPDPTSSSEDEADAASSTSATELQDMLVASAPPRKRATRTVDLDLPPSPAKTPTKLVRQTSSYAPKVPSPLKPRPRREASEFDVMRDEEDEEMAEEEMEISQPAFAPSRLATSASASTATASAAHPLIPIAPNTSYLSSPLRTQILTLLSTLSGSRLPGPFPSTISSSASSILSLPYLEGGYDEWERPLRASLEECVLKGMGNAVMLLGPRGSGKTMLINRTLALLSSTHGRESFVTVRLSGLVHTTDRLAMRSIAVQLRDQGFGGKEVEGEMEGDYSFLYCLLDIVQGNRRRGGVAVVGVSSRVDCLSLLEKRVRSRCQSHVLQLIPPSSFSAFTDLAKRLLRSDEEAWKEKRGEEGTEWAERWNAEVERFLKEKKVVDYFTRMWQIYGNVPTELRSSLSHLLYRLDHVGRLNGLTDSNEVPRLAVEMLKPQPKGEEKSRDEVLKHLSIPELTVLIACKHLSTSTIDRHSGFNFEQIYDAYLSHSRRVSASTASALSMSTKPLSKPAMRVAFDSLREHELLLPRTSSGSAGSSGAGGAATTSGSGMPVSVPSLAYKSPTARDPWKMYRLTAWAKDVDREVEARGGECPLALRRWCKNWLD
ncbi:Origin recognition complex subunit 4 [Rhodotorula toruloides ATCC 204091]|uniref:BY PROTMAP: gi/342320952/gb/EGU12890.1/ Origin recognition complex subunit 4 [Rhodotorula glutinis ATCC 204091] n=1 Tax=Rhodotorula toruloides TaxID=5286 RepID=A0A0K3CB08_RHOTO|nr:Origin recognition complex subunit 4 [Rhodotorula toruloides ATCC 204091]